MPMECNKTPRDTFMHKYISCGVSGLLWDTKKLDALSIL